MGENGEGRSPKQGFVTILLVVSLILSTLGALNSASDFAEKLRSSPGSILIMLLFLCCAAAVTLLLVASGVLRLAAVTQSKARRVARTNAILLLAVVSALLATKAYYARSGHALADGRYHDRLSALSAAAVELSAAEASPLQDYREINSAAAHLSKALVSVATASIAVHNTAVQLRLDVRAALHSIVADIDVADVPALGNSEEARIVRWVEHTTNPNCVAGAGCSEPSSLERGGVAVSDQRGFGGSLANCELHPTDVKAFGAADGTTFVLFGGDVARDGAASGGTYADFIKIGDTALVANRATCTDDRTLRRQDLLEMREGYSGSNGDTVTFLHSLWLDERVPFEECHACEHLVERATYQWSSIDGRFALVDRRIENTQYSWYVRLVRAYPFPSSADASQFISPTADISVVAAFLKAASAKQCSVVPSDQLRFACGDSVFTGTLQRHGVSWWMERINVTAASSLYSGNDAETLQALKDLRLHGAHPIRKRYGPIMLRVPSILTNSFRERE